jgi:hypothetical protein
MHVFLYFKRYKIDIYVFILLSDYKYAYKWVILNIKFVPVYTSKATFYFLKFNEQISGDSLVFIRNIMIIWAVWKFAAHTLRRCRGIYQMKNIINLFIHHVNLVHLLLHVYYYSKVFDNEVEGWKEETILHIINYIMKRRKDNIKTIKRCYNQLFHKLYWFFRWEFTPVSDLFGWYGNVLMLSYHRGKFRLT